MSEEEQQNLSLEERREIVLETALGVYYNQSAKAHQRHILHSEQFVGRDTPVTQLYQGPATEVESQVGYLMRRVARAFDIPYGQLPHYSPKRHNTLGAIVDDLEFLRRRAPENGSRNNSSQKPASNVD